MGTSSHQDALISIKSTGFSLRDSISISFVNNFQGTCFDRIPSQQGRRPVFQAQKRRDRLQNIFHQLDTVSEIVRADLSDGCFTSGPSNISLEDPFEPRPLPEKFKIIDRVETRVNNNGHTPSLVDTDGQDSLSDVASLFEEPFLELDDFPEENKGSSDAHSSMCRLRELMAKSRATQKALEEWDRENGKFF